MVGRTQREEAKAFVMGVTGEAAREALRVMTDVISRGEFTRQDAELLRYQLLPTAQWDARDAAYATLRRWEEDPVGYAMAFLWVAATILAAERAQQQK
jgi:hypothetical protein